LSKRPWVLPVFRPVALLALDTGLPKLHRRFHQTMKPTGNMTQYQVKVNNFYKQLPM